MKKFSLLNFVLGFMPVKGILGSVLGGVAGGLVGGIFQSKAASKAANAQLEAARIAAESAKFDPYNINLAGIGGVTFDTEGKAVDMSLDPRLQALAGGQLGRAEQLLGYSPIATQTDPRLYQLGGGALGGAGMFLNQALGPQQSGMPLFNQGLGLFGTGLGTTNQALNQLQMANLGIGQAGAGIGQAAGMIGQGAGLVNQGLNAASPYFQQAQGIDVAGAGRGFLDQLNMFDPNQATSARFDQLEALLEPKRQQQRQAQEAQLLRQGRLGSTGGSLQQQALEEAFSQQQLQNLLSASGEARAQQQNLLGLGTGLGQEAFGRASGLTNLGISQGGMFTSAGGQLSGMGGQLGSLYGQLGGLAGQTANIGGMFGQLGAQQAGFGNQLANFGMGLEQLGLQRQQQQAGLFGSLLGAGTQLEGLRQAEDLRQLQLEQAYQQAGLSSLQSGMGLFQTPLQLAQLGGEFGGRASSAGQAAGNYLMQGAQGAAAARLGAATGMASMFPQIGSAIGGMFSSAPTRYYEGSGVTTDYGSSGMDLNQWVAQ